MSSPVHVETPRDGRGTLPVTARQGDTCHPQGDVLVVLRPVGDPR